jgi:hypothetical protein
VCNKEGFGRKKRAAQLDDAVTCYSNNDEAEEEDTANEEETGKGRRGRNLMDVRRERWRK